MQWLTPEEAVQAARNQSIVKATISGGAFEISFSDDQPFLCVAVHNGHGMREELEPYCALNEPDRWFEEDPHTGDLIGGLQNTIVAHDSRYEYDLNRAPEDAIYEEAWGEKIWTKSLPDDVRNRSLEKHKSFFQVLHAVVASVVRKHGGCVVYDVHSYNGSRKGGDKAPTFNIGTHSVDMRRHRRSVEFLERALGNIEISNEQTTVGIDEVFEGRGYVAAYLRTHFKKVLCVPIEIRKIFCSEKDGTAYPVVVDSLKAQLTDVISRHAAFFSRSKLARHHAKSHHMLGAAPNDLVNKIDTKLYQFARKLDTLLYVNPINLVQEQKRFQKKVGSYEPQFRYKQLAIDPYLFREDLYRLPVEEITDPTLQQLYRDAIDGLAIKIDLLKAIGTREFLYNSLRYYGEPHINDLKNAEFLLHAPSPPSERLREEAPLMATNDIVHAIQAAVDDYGIDAPVKISGSIVAGAMVDNANFQVFVKKDASLPSKSVEALIHHEVGVHLLSASNARAQNLKVLRLGSPGTTMTQEGLAVYAEHLGGALSSARMKTLGLRVLAVKSLLDNHSFSQTFDLLREEYDATEQNAFITTARVYRGGGFTKDFLYLRGLAQARQYHQGGNDWGPVFAGKIPFSKTKQIEELILRGIVSPPAQIAKCLTEPTVPDPILDYLVSGLIFEGE